MPVFDFKCSECGAIFEALVKVDTDIVKCNKCGKNAAVKLLSAPSFSIKKAHGTGGVERKVKDYLKVGKFSEATRFAD